MNCNKAILIILLLAIFPVFINAQNHYKTPEHSLGIEASWSASNLFNFKSNADQQFSFGLYNLETFTGFGGSILIPYQYAPKGTFLGFQSGLGFFMWGTKYRTSGFNQFENESLYALGIPLVAQFKLGKSFWLESGFQANFAVYNSLRDAGRWDSSKTLQEQPPGRLPLVELQSVLGFRYHFYKSWSIKARLHIGLTPAYHINLVASGEDFHEEIHNRYRLAVFELGMGYLFPLKK
ncbi:MAG: hypothetical protein JJU02_10195 [Cryomorphaceae bacterium]|nr:hypothetical protein [Cryomorphaceae bacterium]